MYPTKKWDAVCSRVQQLGQLRCTVLTACSSSTCVRKTSCVWGREAERAYESSVRIINFSNQVKAVECTSIVVGPTTGPAFQVGVVVMCSTASLLLSTVCVIPAVLTVLESSLDLCHGIGLFLWIIGRTVETVSSIWMGETSASQSHSPSIQRRARC